MNVRTYSRLVFSTVLMVAISSLANQLPLSKDDLKLQASHILTGYVYMIRDSEDGNHNVYKAKMIVHESEKGGFAKNNIVLFTFFRAKTRMEGSNSSIGQLHIMEDHRSVRVWLKQDEQGNLYLLEPNGWEYSDYACKSS